MTNAKLAVLVAGLATLAACANEPARGVDAGPAALPWRIEAAAPALRAASCPGDAEFLLGMSLAISATPVDLGLPAGSDALAPGMRFLAGWSLVSPDARFGGLSGLEVTRSGHLVAVSDDGGFVWIGLDAEDGFRPVSARIADIRDAEGKPLAGKSRRDSEGLALSQDGLALVSFERDHRVLAFDLEGCGAAARGIPVARWGARVTGLGRAIDDNRGAEALALLPDGRLMAGLEENDNNVPVALLPESGEPRFDARLDTPGLLSITGMDALDDRLFTVHRFYAPGVGNRIAIRVSRRDAQGLPVETRTIASIESPLAVDNFEGIAVMPAEDGSTLVFVLSDNNFSASQRTLLFVFEWRP